MKQSIEGTHYTDREGNPAGGYTIGLGIDIRWQNGPLRVDGVKREPTGAFVEGVIAAALDRLEFYQASKFACDENARAIDWLKNALAECERRTKNRTRRGVEGTHTV